MIIHLVFLNMLPESEGSSGSENAQKLIGMLKDLPGKIPEIDELEAGLDISKSPASYEIGLMTKFRSMEDLETYRVHPDHQKVISFVQKTTSARAVTDYVV